MIRGASHEALAAEARTEDVVFFRSGVTDVRGLRSWLERHEVPFREVEMSMGSDQARARFHALQEMTGWKTLPQVFVRGEFVGGEHELKAVVPHQGSAIGARPAAPNLSPMIRLLGYGGLIPFITGALLLGIADPDSVAVPIQPLLLGYGAVILAFLGAIHWGRVLQPKRPERADALTLYGVIPSVLAWGSLALPFAAAAPFQALLFVLVYLVDRAAFAGSGIPAAFLSLRLQLTSVAVASLLIAWASVTL